MKSVDDCFAPDKGELTHDERYNATPGQVLRGEGWRGLDQYATLEDFAKRFLVRSQKEKEGEAG